MLYYCLCYIYTIPYLLLTSYTLIHFIYSDIYLYNTLYIYIGNNDLCFVEAPAIAPPEAEVDLSQMAQNESELLAAANVPLPDGDDDDEI